MKKMGFFGSDIFPKNPYVFFHEIFHVIRRNENVHWKNMLFLNYVLF